MIGIRKGDDVMGIRTGTPTLKLNRQNKFSKNSGNAEAVIKEMLEDENGKRWSADKDYNPELTKNNIVIEGFTNSKEAVDFVYGQAENYVKIDKNGNQRKLRSDAVIALAGIIKPDMESMQKMDEVEQLHYLKAHWDEQKKVLEESGIEVLSAVIHRDEVNPHIHYLGYDPDYKLGKKVDIKLFRRFNKEIPEKLQGQGYDVEVLERYNPDEAKVMNPDELKQYKSKIIQEKKTAKKTAQSSNVFKAQKTAENIIINAEKRAKKKELEAEDHANYMLNTADEFIKGTMDKNKQHSESLDALRNALEDDLKAFEEEKVQLYHEKQKVRKERLEVSEVLTEAKDLVEKLKEQNAQRVDGAIWEWLNGKGGVVERMKQHNIVRGSFDIEKSFNTYQQKKIEDRARIDKRAEMLLRKAEGISGQQSSTVSFEMD